MSHHCKRDYETTQSSAVFCLACRIFLKKSLLRFKMMQSLHKNPDQIWPLLGSHCHLAAAGGAPGSPVHPSPHYSLSPPSLRLSVRGYSSVPPSAPRGCFVYNERESLGPVCVCCQRRRRAPRLVCVLGRFFLIHGPHPSFILTTSPAPGSESVCLRGPCSHLGGERLRSACGHGPKVNVSVATPPLKNKHASLCSVNSGSALPDLLACAALLP